MSLLLYVERNEVFVMLMHFVFLSFADERDAIQKKTFTKWVNKHLKKVSPTTKPFEVII